MYFDNFLKRKTKIVISIIIREPIRFNYYNQVKESKQQRRVFLIDSVTAFVLTTNINLTAFTN